MNAFKTQSELTVTDLFPEYERDCRRSRGLKTQMDFLFKVQSRPLVCPRCGGTHTVNELAYQTGNDRDRLTCPVQGKGVVHNMGLFGDEWLEAKE